jgi:hypothetical protein
MWAYSETLFQDAVNCNVGKAPCTTGKQFKLVDVPVSAADRALISSAVSKVSLPIWAEVCDKSNPGCSQKWKETVGPIVGLK